MSILKFVNFNELKSAFTISLQNNAVCMKNLYGELNVDGNIVNTASFSPFVAINDKEFIQESKQLGLTWIWQFEEKNGAVEITASIKNTGSKPIKIRDWSVIKSKSENGCIDLAENLDEVRFFKWVGWDMNVETLFSGTGEHSSTTIMHLSDPETQLTLLSGFVTLTRMSSSHNLYFKDGKIRLYEAVCSFGEYTLSPDEVFTSETLRIEVYKEPFEALEAWATLVNEKYNPPIAKSAPVGWIGPFKSGVVKEEFSLKNAELIRQKLKGFPVNYVWTSQYNLKDYIPGNWESVNEKHFPNGIKSFCDKMAKLGFKAGFWISPFWFYDEAEGVFDRCRDFLLKDKNGDFISETGAWCFEYGDDEMKWYHMHKYFLDGSNPQAQNYIYNLFKKYYDAGVRYYMLDFLALQDTAKLHNSKMLPMEAGREILKAIRSAAGEETHLQTAVSSTPGYLDIVNAARVGRDFGEDRPLTDELDGALSDWSNATRVLHDDHYANLKAFLQNMGANYFTHRKLYMNDGNLLTVDAPVPLEHARFAATAYGMCSDTPMMLGDDFTVIDDERLALIKMCLPRAPFMAKPADLFQNVYPYDHFRILSLNINENGDEYSLFAVFNPENKPYNTTLSFEKLGLEKDTPYRVFDFWNQQYIGTYHTKLDVLLQPESCKLYRISKARKHPWILGTNMHILQGAAEIKNIAWDEDSMTLSGIASRPKGEKGNIYFLMPKNFETTTPENVTLTKELLDMTVIIRMPIVFESDEQEFSLSFKPWRHKNVVPNGYLPFVTEEEWRRFREENRPEGDTRVYE